MEEIEKIYFQITEVSEITNLPMSTLRFWEREFDQLSVKKGMNDHRLYTKEDIDLILLIKYLVKENGFTLQGAKEKLKREGKDALYNKVEIIKSLLKIRNFLTDLKASL